MASWDTTAPLPLAVYGRNGLHSTDGDVGPRPPLAATVPSELSSLIQELCLHSFLWPASPPAPKHLPPGLQTQYPQWLQNSGGSTRDPGTEAVLLWIVKWVRI